MKVFQTSVSWFSTGVWVTASLLTSPGLFLVFWKISTMFVWYRFVLLFSSPPVSLSVLCWLYWSSQLQVISPLLSCFIIFFNFSSKIDIYLSFRFLSVLARSIGMPVYYLACFTFVVDYHLVRSSGRDEDIGFYLKIEKNFVCLIFGGGL